MSESVFNIKDVGSLRLVGVPTEVEKVEEDVLTNYVFIIDCSGSMYSYLDKLKTDIKANLTGLVSNSTISIARFSSKGDYNFFVKGFKLNGSEDLAGLFKLIDKYIHSSGCTCYSEVFEAAYQVIEDLSLFSKKFCLGFLTDGYPNEGSESVLLSAISKIKGYVKSSLIIGYGDYYNKPLLSKMSGLFNSCQLVHADSSKKSEDFTQYFKSFITSSVEEGLQIPVSVDTKSAFALIKGSIVRLSLQDGFIVVPKSLKSYYLLSSYDLGVKSTTTVGLLKGLYALAVIKLQDLELTDCLSVLSFIEDVATMDAVNNAFTMYEYGEAEKFITSCIFDAKKRYLKGQKAGYLPDPNAFCLYDALQMLIEDQNAVFYPRHEEFSYTRIGKPAAYADNSLVFTAEPNVACEFNKLNWNKSRLNLSILADIPGTAKLADKRAEELGLPEDLKTRVFRNYALINDGVLNVRRLPFSASKAVVDTLTAAGMVEDYDRNVKILNLTAVPLISRKYVSEKPSAIKFASVAATEKITEICIKAVKHFISEQYVGNDEAKAIAKSADLVSKYGEEAAAYLAEFGVTDKGFSAKTIPSESTDQYMAKEFELKIKSFSSIPAVNSVLDKMASGKKLTPSEQVMSDYIVGLKASLEPSKLNGQAVLQYLETTLEQLKCNLADIRSTLQVNKFAVILCKQWFSEFKSFDPADCKVTVSVDGYSFEVSFVLEDVKVPI